MTQTDVLRFYASPAFALALLQFLVLATLGSFVVYAASCVALLVAWLLFAGRVL